MNTIKFLITVLFAGLAQIWIILLYSYFQGIPQYLTDLLSQSGIFFFSSSLTATSLWKHNKVFNRVSSNECYFSTFIFIAILIICVIAVISGLKFDPNDKVYSFSSTQHHTNFAIGCLITSITYSLFAEKRATNFSIS